MRTKDTLFAFNDIPILLQYLYMDENHSIVFNNDLTDLRIHMTNSLIIRCQNMSFPDLPETNWSDNMSPSNCLGIIDRLKTMPAVEYKDSFSNRWDEIKATTLGNMALNRS